MFKYIVGTIIAAISWFFWIEPMFFKQASEHPSMTLFNASEQNPVLKQWNETVAKLSNDEVKPLKESFEQFSIDGFSLQDISNADLEQALEKAINTVCRQPGFSERFETSAQQCVDQTLKYFERCGDSLLETYQKLMTDPESMMESTSRGNCN